MPYFHSENPIEFCVGYGSPGFVFVYTTCIYMLASWRTETLQSVKHVDACHIHRETNVTWWHGSRQSHDNDCAHNIVWICTYGNHPEHIPILRGQEFSWLEWVTHVATRVHHTKCTITHTRAGIYIYIMHNGTTQSGRVNQTLSIFQGYGLAR